MEKKDLVKINDYLWEIPKEFRSDMRVPARVYVSEKMLEEIFRDRSLNQLVNITTLPGIVNYSLAMPDIHEGYGFPIGGVAGIRANDGIISPGGVGYDINCGMRILLSSYAEKELNPYLKRLAEEIAMSVPSGLGRGHKKSINRIDLDKILNSGARELVQNDYGEADDLKYCESGGCLEMADARVVSNRAKNRGGDQVGTLGSGNHFLEIQKVAEIFNKEVAKQFNLFSNQIIIMIHTGSRGLGHQVATDYIQVMMRAMSKYKINLPDRELACAPFNSDEGQNYFQAMAAAANFAWANRQMISFYVRQAWEKILGKGSNLKILYDVAHNIAKLEEYEVNGQRETLIVHRKGATRAFPAHHPEIPEEYQSCGQPVLIPGSMGTASYVLVGVEKSKETWHSTCHGAGRRMSRASATKNLSVQEILNNLKQKGVLVECNSLRGLAEEAPEAYKDIDEVVNVVDQSGLSIKVAKLVPLAVIKGE
ncbi:MAG TPA: RtcB family protein [Candidatus Paceibacterota bacterium]|nr:RtcB family protein [Candidatus Paceibacterota bacterium]